MTLRRRRTIRLKGYDYSQPGAYFITICTKDRFCCFGEVIEGRVKLNEAGQMVARWWDELPNKFPSVVIDEYIVMPNHFHGILIIVGADLRVRPNTGAHIGAPLQTDAVHHEAVGADLGVRPESDAHIGVSQRKEGKVDLNVHPESGIHIGVPLHLIIQWFKTMATNEYILGVKQNGWSPFPGKLWQRSYYEHIIRHDDELNRLRNYIANNPIGWELDKYHPTQAKKTGV